MKEHILWRVKWEIHKFDDPTGEIASKLKSGISIDELRHQVTEHLVFYDNLALDEGLEEVAKLITATGGTPYDNTNAHIGIGDGTDAEDSTQTGLTGTNKVYLPMDAGYPQTSGGSAIFRATADGTTANFDWNEFTVCNSNDETTGKNLNRKVTSKGTKNSGETWVLTVTITFTS